MNSELFDQLICQKNYISKTYHLNQNIKREIGFSKKIYLIVEGMVSINYITDEGRDTVSLILGKDQTFGIGDMLGISYLPYDSKSIHEKTVIYTFDINIIHTLIKQNRNLLKDLLYIINEKQTLIESRIRILTMQSTEERLLASFVELAKKSGLKSEDSKDVTIFLPLHQCELGSYIRTSRITVCRILNSLKYKSILSYKENIIVFRKEFFDTITSKISR